MKVATVVGILLIVVGFAGFALGGISFTHEKKDIDLGPLQVSHKEKSTLPISPILSGLSSQVLAWWWLAYAANRRQWRAIRANDESRRAENDPAFGCPLPAIGDRV
jgi:hypothetical protein